MAGENLLAPRVIVDLEPRLNPRALEPEIESADAAEHRNRSHVTARIPWPAGAFAASADAGSPVKLNLPYRGGTDINGLLVRKPYKYRSLPFSRFYHGGCGGACPRSQPKGICPCPATPDPSRTNGRRNAMPVITPVRPAGMPGPRTPIGAAGLKTGAGRSRRAYGRQASAAAGAVACRSASAVS
jgi:hypothetical protein